MNRESIEKYQEIFRKDPNSRVFAALADAYLEMGMVEQAEKLARQGVGRHPNYVSGFVALGKILIQKQAWKEAEQNLLKAAAFAPENLLAHQLLGQIYLSTQRPKEALKAYKMALFLNPQSEKSRRAVAKLESLSADEFDRDVFEMKRIQDQDLSSGPAPKSMKSIGKSKERSLSLVDALIVRNELSQARELLRMHSIDFAGDPDFEKRWQLLDDEEELEKPMPLQPNMKRENRIRERKLQRLNFVLQRIKELQT